MESVWTDPRTWISIVSLGIGAAGLLYGIISGYWNRRESRMDALSKILEPMVKAAQHLNAANSQRRKCEQLKFSFPDAANAQDAQTRINQLVQDYGTELKNGQTELRAAESGFASRSFRFPTAVSRLISNAIKTLSEVGQFVNEGQFDNTELQIARFRDDYSQITKFGRGWRLIDPLEGLKARMRRTRKVQLPAPDDFEISDNDLRWIMNMVNKLATGQVHGSFAIHPPKKLLENPTIASSDNVIDELKDSIFVVAFQNGESKMITFAELIFFVFNHVTLAVQWREVNRMVAASQSPPTNINVSLSFSSRMSPGASKPATDGRFKTSQG